MNIAELFVTLSLNGGKKTSKDLNSVGNEMKGVSKKALALFASIAGISYGLKQLSSNVMANGTRMTKFSNLTGQSAQTLQRWQYILRQSGVASEEVTSNVEGLAKSIAEMQKTGQFSGEFLRISELTNIDPSKLEDTFYILEKFREFTRSGLPTAQVNSLLGGFLSDDMIQALRTNDMNPDQVPAGAVSSDRQLKALQKSKAMFDQFQADIEKKFSDLFVRIGPKVIPKLMELSREVINLTEALIKFFDNNKVFDMLREFLSAVTKLLKGDFFGAATNMETLGKLETDVLRGGWYEKAVKDYVTPVVSPVTGALDSGVMGAIELVQNFNFGGVDKSYAAGIAKAAREGATQGVNKAQSMQQRKTVKVVN